MQITYKDNEIPNMDDDKCSVIYALEIIGGKWKLPIIWKLSKQDSMRYNELKRELKGITNVMLTRSLTFLEERGLVTRTEYEQIPPRVEYSLTDSARMLLPALEVFKDWGRIEMNKARDEKRDKEDV